MPSVAVFSLPLCGLKAAALLAKRKEAAPETHTHAHAASVHACRDQSVREKMLPEPGRQKLTRESSVIWNCSLQRG